MAGRIALKKGTITIADGGLIYIFLGLKFRSKRGFVAFSIGGEMDKGFVSVNGEGETLPLAGEKIL